MSSLNVIDLQNEIKKIDETINTMKNYLSVKYSELSTVNSAVSDNAADIKTLETFLVEQAQPLNTYRSRCVSLYKLIYDNVIILTPNQISVWQKDIDANLPAATSALTGISPIILQEPPVGMNIVINPDFLTEFDKILWSMSDWIYYNILSTGILTSGTFLSYYLQVKNPDSNLNRYFISAGMPLSAAQQEKARTSWELNARMTDARMQSVSLMNGIKEYFNSVYPVLEQNYDTLVTVYGYYDQNKTLADAVKVDITDIKNKIVESYAIKEKYQQAIISLQEQPLIPAVPDTELPPVESPIDTPGTPPIDIHPLPGLPDLPSEPILVDIDEDIKEVTDESGDIITDYNKPGDTDIPGAVLTMPETGIQPVSPETPVKVPATAVISIAIFLLTS